MKLSKLSTTLLSAFWLAEIAGLAAGGYTHIQNTKLENLKTDYLTHWENGRPAIEKYDFQPNQNAKSGVLAAEMQKFVDALPAEVLSNEAHAVYALPDVLSGADIKVMDEFKKIFSAAYEKDEIANRLQMPKEYIDTEVLPQIMKMYFASIHYPEKIGGFMNYSKGTLFAGLSQQTAHTLLHEMGHYLGFAEDGAEFFANYLNGGNATRQRADWEYGDHQIRTLHNICLAKNEETRFWKALTSDNELAQLWSENMPSVKQDGFETDTPVMTFTEWQTIRAISKELKDTTEARDESTVNDFMDINLLPENSSLNPQCAGFITWQSRLNQLSGVTESIMTTPNGADIYGQDLREATDKLMMYAAENGIMPLRATYQEYVPTGAPTAAKTAQAEKESALIRLIKMGIDIQKALFLISCGAAALMGASVLKDNLTDKKETQNAQSQSPKVRKTLSAGEVHLARNIMRDTQRNTPRQRD